MSPGRAQERVQIGFGRLRGPVLSEALAGLSPREHDLLGHLGVVHGHGRAEPRRGLPADVFQRIAGGVPQDGFPRFHRYVCLHFLRDV
jgi:hypothetical protein